MHFLTNNIMMQKELQCDNHDNKGDDNEEVISSVIRIVKLLKSLYALTMRKIIFVNSEHILPQAFLFLAG